MGCSYIPGFVAEGVISLTILWFLNHNGARKEGQLKWIVYKNLFTHPMEHELSNNQHCFHNVMHELLLLTSLFHFFPSVKNKIVEFIGSIRNAIMSCLLFISNKLRLEIQNITNYYASIVMGDWFNARICSRRPDGDTNKLGCSSLRTKRHLKEFLLLVGNLLLLN